MSTADASPNPSSEHPTSSGSDSTHVNLRVTYLHAGNPRPPHELGRISTDTTVGALKGRLHHELLENPRPEEQRLIYQGRPLLQDAVTLREALRLDGPIRPLPYTIHIIIQPRQAASHFRPDPSANVPTPPAVNGGVPGPGALPPNAPAQQPLGHDHQQEALRMHAMAQAHLNMLQQQLHTLQQQQGQAMPQRFSATFQINGQHIQPPMHLPPNAHAQPGAPTATNESTDDQSQQAPPQPPHIAGAMPQPLQQGHPNPLVNGILNQGQPGRHVPFQRPLSVPPPTRLDAAAHPFHVPPPPHFAPPLPGFGLPIPPVRAMPHQPLPQPAEPMVWLASSRNGPQALLFAPGHGYFSSASGTASLAGRAHLASQVRQHLQNQVATRAPIAPTPTTNDRAAGRNDAQPPANAQQPPANIAAGPLALQQAPQPGQAPGAHPRPQALNDDFMGLVIQRGWLFLRLYMFMFILSEPGTWRRYLLLALALIVCLLPRQNPLNHLVGAARRHIDNLIGPPAPQRAPNAAAAQAQPRQAAGAPAATGGPRAPAARGGAANMTPEQAAARILSDRAEQDRRQRDANPNVLRDAFYRVEQAIALFLASLIPGVGERHVAAREEQRRERLRVEMERANAEREAAEAEVQRRREEAEAMEQQVGGNGNAEHRKADGAVAAADGLGEGAAAGSSTGVEALAGGGIEGDEQVRQRSAGEHAS